MKKRSFLTARTTLALAAAAALGATTVDAWALGLGRLNVQSALGEGLRAEIDITSLTPEEASTLAVRIASPESYRAAGVDYNSVLSSTQAVLARRADGRPYLRVVSDRAVQEPFIDVILEVSWSTGKLVREFTLLLDPPSNRVAPPVQAAAPIAPAIAPAPAPAAAPAAPPPVAAAPRAPASPPPAAVPTPAPRPAADAAGASEYRVRSGDTLSRIAGRTQRPGVALDQMLVGLFRANPDAFLGNNMNRLKSGVVLSVPSADTVKGIAPSEAREVIAAQSADFGAYRSRLAEGAPQAGTVEPARQDKGKVQAAVDDKKQAAAASADKLKLSGAAAKASAPEAQISKAAERKDNATRVAELTRNVEELKKLQQGTAAAQPAPAPAPAPAVAVPVPAPAPAAVAPPPAAPAPAPAAMASAPAPAVQASAPAAAASAPRLPASRPPAAAPAQEPGFLDSILDNPLALPGAGLLAIVLAGLGYYKFRGRGGRKDRTETSFLESRVQPDSFFGASGGQRIDTSDQSAGSSSMGFSLSQLDAIGDVDPVAEADVYLAYGRDLQAEEILKEAMRTTPDRLAIRTKLLEVYAKRRDTKGFELLATQLFAITQGSGADWEKAQEMGRQIDPENPLYQPGGRPEEVIRDGHVIPDPISATTLPQSVMPTPSMFPTDGGAPTLPAEPHPVDLDLDFDLEPAEGTMDMTRPLATSAVPAASGGDIDFDFSAEPTTISQRKVSAPAPSGVSMDFNLDDLSLDDTEATLPTSEATLPMTTAPAPARNDALLDFGEFALSEPATLPGKGSAPLHDDSELPSDDADPIARKLELAEEFRQIGDMEGARDLLEEVIGKSTGSLKAKAQGMLDQLG
ncbi:FimV/HubP family polar landmark protein [Aquabacterium sp.]|uniref:FimV/HubP family polar landmark protein n=1 Tax=Aquabacterium sp. TaxID=1872578 RepID=UPI002BD9371D|nr:FimV/HubP family polar landmark protein [Aquabacterium sp.]HSW07235.1 FimV/HubP family polar landmark protein [Aquabacterium sp.]